MDSPEHLPPAELPPDEPSGSDSMFEDAEFQAQLAFYRLDTVLGQWMKAHPEATAEQVDVALAEFRAVIARRDSGTVPEQ